MNTHERVLIVSPYQEGPDSPLPDGPRLRIIGLANLLADSGMFTVSITTRGRLGGSSLNPKVKKLSWHSTDELAKQISESRIIVSSYAALGLNNLILKVLKVDQVLVADAMVPIELENRARTKPQQIDGVVLRNFLKRSQIIITSSNRSIDYYLKSISPEFIDARNTAPAFVSIPFVNENLNIDTTPVSIDDTLRLVYYGGVYPWFGITNLIEFIRKLPRYESKLNITFMGLNNPNLRDDEIDEISNLVISESKYNRNIHFKPWLSGSKRFEFLSKFDSAIFFNNPENEETKYSWRTRYADFLSAKLPLMCNSADPFFDVLVENELGFIRSCEDILSLGSDDVLRSDIKRRLLEIKSSPKWTEVQNTFALKIYRDNLSKAIKSKV
jgi:hypothetical protein